MVIRAMPEVREEDHPPAPTTFQSAYIELEGRHPPKSSLLNSNPGKSPGSANGGDLIGNLPNVAPDGCHTKWTSEPYATSISLMCESWAA
jgi:hypothetical protein